MIYDRFFMVNMIFMATILTSMSGILQLFDIQNCWKSKQKKVIY